MKSLVATCLVVLASTASAAPGAQNGWKFSTAEKSYYAAVGKRVAEAPAQPGFPGLPSCDISTATLPQAPIPLPAPGAGMELAHVVIGRGTQNYTCATNTTTSKPVAIGAVASLYNISCIATNYPELTALMPNVALQYPVPTSDDPLSPANVLLMGHHYFTNNFSTPVFNFDTPEGNYGIGAFKKANSTAAPKTAVAGSVAWLKLVANNETATPEYKEVYRVDTAGGNPPDTCDGMGATFEVPYSAVYWLYR